MNKPRILVIENSIHVTGSLKSVLLTSCALNSKYEFIFVLPRGSHAVPYVKNYGFTVYELPMKELSRRIKSFLIYLPNLIRTVFSVRKIALHENIRFVHVNDFYNMIMPLWRLLGGRIKYVNYVRFVPNVFPSMLRWTWIKAHRIFSEKIIGVSMYVVKQLPIHTNVICIPDSLPEEDESIQNEALPPRRRIFLYVGNLIEGKGQDAAIKVFASLTSQYPDWKLRFVGGDMGLEKNKRYKEQLLKLANNLLIGDKIEWQEFVLNIKDEYRKATIALNFSVSESYSRTVQEAMFYGCSVIATNSGGPAELIDDGYSGILVPVNDVTAMTKAMKFLIENETVRKKMANNAARSIREKYSKANTVDLLENTYDSVINY